MAVRGDAVGVHPLGNFGEQRSFLGSAPCPAHPRLGVDDDVVRLDHAGLDDGHQRQQRRGRVATRACHQPGAGDLGAGEFGQAVDGVLLHRRRLMRLAVPGGIDIRIGEAEVGREIDHLHPLGHGRGHRLGGAVRQAKEGDVDAVPVERFDRLQ